MEHVETLAQLGRWHETQGSRSQDERDKRRHKSLAASYWRQVFALDNPPD